MKHEIGYMVHVSNPAFQESDFIFLKCVESFLRHSDASQLLLYTLKNQSIVENDLLQNQRVTIKYLNEEEWGRSMMDCKIKTILSFLNSGCVKKGSHILVLDSDLFFQADPFAVFENDFDVFVTSRNYEYKFPINAGVWGFKYNKRSKKFLQYYVDNLHKASWLPYINFRKDNHGNEGLADENWWKDQDFLCALYLEHKEGLEDFIKLYDATHKYNFCPHLEQGEKEAKRQLEGAIGDITIPILHLKGGLKKLIDIKKL